VGKGHGVDKSGLGSVLEAPIILTKEDAERPRGDDSHDARDGGLWELKLI
jgi:hypothetical protein